MGLGKCSPSLNTERCPLLQLYIIAEMLLVRTSLGPTVLTPSRQGFSQMETSPHAVSLHVACVAA